MQTLQDILQNQGAEFLDGLMNDYVLVYEKLSASTLSFRRIGNELHFYKGSDKEEITSINATLYRYFQDGMDYIKRVSLIFYMEFPEGWLFKCQYFVSNKTNLIEYDYVPQNNLVLSCIDSGTSMIEDPDVLKRWAERLQIDYSQPLFQGFLSEFQKEKINDFLKGSVPEGITFSQYIATVLNPNASHSLYKRDFNGGVDSFIFKFYKPKSKKTVCAKIVDPYMASLLNSNKNKYNQERYNNEDEIILANFIAYMQTVNLSEIKAEGDTDDERYMDVICKLFNRYMEKEVGLYKGVEESVVSESFGVNLDNVKNEKTRELLKNNPNLTTAFQIIVGSFADKKDPNDVNPTSLIDNELVGVFNKEVENIRSIAKKEEKVKTFMDLMNPKNGDVEPKGEEKVMDFVEFMKSIGEYDRLEKPAEKEPKSEEDNVKTEPEKHEEKHEEEKKDTEPKEQANKENGEDSDAKDDKEKDTDKKENEKTEEDEKDDSKDNDAKVDGSDNDEKDKEDKKDEPKEELKKDNKDDVKEEDAEKEESDNKDEHKGEDAENGSDEAKQDDNKSLDKNENKEKEPQKEEPKTAPDKANSEKEDTKSAKEPKEKKEPVKKEKPQKNDAPKPEAL